MSQVIRQEAAVFLAAVFHGMFLSCVYDVLRALRRVFRHSALAVGAEDFLFWLAAGFLTFVLLFLEADGVVRGYVAAGAALGVFLYLGAFSRLFLKIMTGILGGIRKAARFVSFPLRKIIKKIKKRIEITGKKGYNKKVSNREARKKAGAGRRRHHRRGSIDGTKQGSAGQQK